MNNWQLMKKPLNPKPQENESGNIVYLVYTFVYIDSGTAPDTFIYLIHKILSGTICAHVFFFLHKIACFGKRNLSYPLPSLSKILKGNNSHIGKGQNITNETSLDLACTDLHGGEYQGSAGGRGYPSLHQKIQAY